MKHTIHSLLIIAVLLPLGIAAQWSTAVNIAPNAQKAQMNENMGPCIAVNNDTLHVIWSDVTSAGSAIYYTRSDDTGHTWSAAVAITDTSGHATMPSIAVSGNNVHIVWWDSLNEGALDGLSGNSSFYKHSLDGGNTWGAKMCIDSNTKFWPGVAVADTIVLVSLNKGTTDSTSVWLTISDNNGAGFGPEQLISTRTGPGRSEDQATATDGKYVHMSWNDNRSGTMQIYYRRSADMGVSWDSEVVISSINSYTTMVCLDNSHVDVAYGADSVYFNSWVRQSDDLGATRDTGRQVTSNSNAGNDQLYPFLVRNDMNLHMVSFDINPRQEYYSYSGDGGATWSPQLLLGHGTFSSFIALTCPVLHVVWPDSGGIFYRRNPTGNPACAQTVSGILATGSLNESISIYPNPSAGTFYFTGVPAGAQIQIYNILGERVSSSITSGGVSRLGLNNEAKGIYFYHISDGEKIIGNGKMIVE